MGFAGQTPRRNVALWPWCPVGLEEQARLSPSSSALPLEGRHAGAHLCPWVWGQPHPRLLLPSLGYLCKGHMLDPQGCAPSFILTSFPSSERGFGALWATAWWLQWLTPPADVC